MSCATPIVAPFAPNSFGKIHNETRFVSRSASNVKRHDLTQYAICNTEYEPGPTRQYGQRFIDN